MDQGTLMGIMVSEGYEALIGACTTEAKAKASAEAIPAGEQLVTNRDVAEVREDFSELRAASMLIVLFACRATVMNLRPPAGFSGKKRARAVSGPHEQKRTRLQGLLCLPILLMCFPPAVYCQAQPSIYRPEIEFFVELSEAEVAEAASGPVLRGAAAKPELAEFRRVEQADAQRQLERRAMG